MIINKKVKNFIEDNIKLIENNEWEEIYKRANKNLWGNGIGEFTTIILKANIDPLNYMDYVPDFYLYNSNISGKFVIPNHIKSIGSSAFFDCSSLTGITIGNGVTGIGEDAFCYCDSLTSITIPDSVTSLGNSAFLRCSSLTNVVIPNSVTSIGDYTFYNCSSLTSVYYKGTMADWNKINKEDDWSKESLINTIHCTNGDIEIGDK